MFRSRHIVLNLVQRFLLCHAGAIDGYISGYEACHTRLRKFANRVYSILGVKALNGCDDKTWDKFCNGNGTDVGNDMNSLVKTAQKLSK